MAELNATEIFARAKDVVGASIDAELAPYLGKSANQISVWRQRNTIPIAQLVQFAQAQGVSLEWLLTGSKFFPKESRVDLGLFMEIWIAVALAHEDWHEGDPESRAALRLTFGRLQDVTEADLRVAAPQVLAERLEGAFAAGQLPMEAAQIYNLLAGEAGSDPPSDTLFEVVYRQLVDGRNAPLSIELRESLRRRVGRLLAHASTNLKDLREVHDDPPQASTRRRVSKTRKG